MGSARLTSAMAGILLGLTACVTLPTWAAEGRRDLIMMPKVAPGSVVIGGEYWALLIGIDEYRHVATLQSAVRDVQAVREVLVQRYGFVPDKIIEVINQEATREGIENALYHLRKKAGPEDSVLIYYAGHGQMDQEDQIGYWVPVEGKAQSPGTFVSNARIRDEIARMKAKHVYLVADSCFSGTLFAAGRTLPPLNDRFFQRLYANRSRWGLTSGMNEPVTDAGKDGHSIFAYFFLKLLRENDDPYLVPSHIYDQIAPLISRNTAQQPMSQPLQGAGDEGGQFVFRLVSAGGNVAGSAVGGGRASSDASTEDLARMKAELEMLKAEIKKAKPAEPQSIEKVPARPYEGPPQAGKELTGKDGAPMVLVPAGDFIMGSAEGEADEQPVHQVSLDAFYLDQYEVTTSRYARFLQATGREAPPYWNSISLGRDDAKPVIGVNWDEADAYCRWAGRRLPTEAEWEKAARGTDGRIYPWGNEAPTAKRASLNKTWPGEDNVYRDALTPVGSFPAGRSPYGIDDLAGSVWEWVADWYDENSYKNSPSQNPKGPERGAYKVLRGGSWGSHPGHLRSAHRALSNLTQPPYRLGFYGFRCAKTP